MVLVLASKVLAPRPLASSWGWSLCIPSRMSLSLVIVHMCYSWDPSQAACPYSFSLDDLISTITLDTQGHGTRFSLSRIVFLKYLVAPGVCLITLQYKGRGLFSITRSGNSTMSSFVFHRKMIFTRLEREQVTIEVYSICLAPHSAYRVACLPRLDLWHTPAKS